ncbi:MAG: hypothetical protein HRU20_14495 [Pseudomonadales bacterium]|nr:hypothetical protein [Pseudomonadales bacterium]
MQHFLEKHPLIFCLIITSGFAAIMYVGSLYTLSFKAANHIAMAVAGGFLGWVIALEILMLKTARKLKILQLCVGAAGGMITAACIHVSITALLTGAGIGLLLAFTANKRIYSTQ